MDAKSSDRSGAWRELSAAERWLGRTDRLPRRAEAEAVVLTDVIGERGGRVLDLGTGDGYMLETLRIAGRCAEGIGVDFSQPLLEAAARRFAEDHTVRLIEHDLAHPLLQALGEFDVVISALAIHHLEDGRKRELYGECATCFARPAGKPAPLPMLCSCEEQASCAAPDMPRFQAVVVETRSPRARVYAPRPCW